MAFIGNATNETFTANATQFGRLGDNLLSYSGVSLLALDGNLGSNTLDLSSAVGSVGVSLTGPGSLEGFAGVASIPGLIFTNFSNIMGNGDAGSTLSGLNAPATWTVNEPAIVAVHQRRADAGLHRLPHALRRQRPRTPSRSTACRKWPDGKWRRAAATASRSPLAALAGPVTLNDVGGSGVNTATVNGPSADNSLTVTPTAVTWNSSRNRQLQPDWKGSRSIPAPGTDTIAVQGTAAGTPTTVSGGGTDTFVVTSPAGLLNTFPSALPQRRVGE